MAASTISFSISSKPQAANFRSYPSSLGSSSCAIAGIRLLPSSLQKPGSHEIVALPSSRTGSIIRASIFPFSKKKNKEALKQELLEAIAPLDRGVAASSDDISRIEKLAQDLESVNPVKQTITSPLINGKWELLYTTSSSVLKKDRPKVLRPGPIFQAINNDTLRAQNIESWPFFNQVTANLTPVSGKKVAVKFDFFKIAGLISIKAPETARGELEITYLDEELRVSRGDKGNLFILKMVDPLYRVPA